MPIGIGAALGIAAVSAGGTAAASIYGSKRAGDLNEKALATDERVAREDRESRERAYTQAAETDRQHWADYIRVNEPNWNRGQQVLGTLYDLAGYQGGAPSPPQIPQQPPPGASAPPLESRPVSAGAQAGAPASRGRALYNATHQPMAPAPPPQSMTLMDLMNLRRMAAGSPQTSIAGEPG